MSEAIKTLIIGVLGSLLGSLLTLLVIYTYKQFVEIKSVRYYKSFWNFINKSVVIVQPVYIDSTGKDLPERFSHISDTIAIQCITNYLRDSKIEYNIIDHNQGIPENSDLILICGPKGNKKSKKK
jgi:hypothetical protein